MQQMVEQMLALDPTLDSQRRRLVRLEQSGA